jgi:hypothetical protein
MLDHATKTVHCANTNNERNHTMTITLDWSKGIPADGEKQLFAALNKTYIEFTLNGIHFEVGQIPDGEFKDKWVWSTEEDESQPFDNAVEAQQDAIRYVREQEAA